MPQSLVQNLQHTVFSTSGRLKMIENEWEQELYRYIGGILNNMECRLLSAGGTADHIHLLSSLNKKIRVPDLVMKVKSSSSAWIHTRIPGRSKFAWQRGYASFSVSESQVIKVSRYIENQAAHHCRRGFQEELRSMLDRHHLKYDERYLWD